MDTSADANDPAEAIVNGTEDTPVNAEHELVELHARCELMVREMTETKARSERQQLDIVQLQTQVADLKKQNSVLDRQNKLNDAFNLFRKGKKAVTDLIEENERLKEEHALVQMQANEQLEALKHNLRVATEDIEILQIQRAELESQLTQVVSENATLGDAAARVTAELGQERTERDKVERECAQLRSDREFDRSQRLAALPTDDESAVLCRLLNDELRQARETIGTLQHSQNELKEQMEQSRCDHAKSVDVFRADLVRLHAELEEKADREKRLAEAETANSTLRAEIASLIQEVHEAKAAQASRVVYDRLLEEHQTLTAAHQSCLESNKALQDKFLLMDQSNADLRVELETLRAANEEYEQQIMAFEGNIVGYESETKALRHQLNDLEKAHEDVLARNERGLKKRRHLEQTLAEQTSSLEDSMKELAQRTEALAVANEQGQQLGQRLEQTETSLNAQLARVASLEADLRQALEVSADMPQLHEHVHRLETELGERDHSITIIQERLAEMLGSEVQLRDDIRESRIVCDRQLQEMEALKVSEEALLEKCQALENALKYAREESEHVNEQRADTEDELIRLKTSLENLESEKRTIERKLTATVRDLQKQLERELRFSETPSDLRSVTSAASTSSPSTLEPFASSSNLQREAETLIHRLADTQALNWTLEEELRDLQSKLKQAEQAIAAKSELLQDYILKDQVLQEYLSRDQPRSSTAVSPTVTRSSSTKKAATTDPTRLLEINHRLQVLLEDMATKNHMLKQQVEELEKERLHRRPTMEDF